MLPQRVRSQTIRGRIAPAAGADDQLIIMNILESKEYVNITEQLRLTILVLPVRSMLVETIQGTPTHWMQTKDAE